MTYNIPDLDIDVANRDDILKHLKHIPASRINDKGIHPHGVGVYFCDVPNDLISGLCSIDYKRAEEEYGFIKVDILHNTAYDNYKSRTEILNCLNTPIKWELLNDRKFVETLPHIGTYYDMIMELPPIDSIDKLAMFIALIRPNKKCLIPIVKHYGWDSIVDKIWIKEDGGYQYKKSHAISYAVMISLKLH